ncbi:MAG: hypothetical protein ACLQCU_09770 [Acidimicrobiales bacterium]
MATLYTAGDRAAKPEVTHGTPRLHAGPCSSGPSSSAWAAAQLVDGQFARGQPDGAAIHSDEGARFTFWVFTGRALDSGPLTSIHSCWVEWISEAT